MQKKYYDRTDYADDVREIMARAEAMKGRRSRYEVMWRNNIYAFIHFITTGDTPERQFNPNVAPELQIYYNDSYSPGNFKFTDTRYPLEFAVVMRKMANEMPNLPNAEWLIHGEEDQSPALVWGEAYNQIIYEGESDYENFELMLGKDVFGTSISWSRVVEESCVIREAKFEEDGTMTWGEAPKDKTVKHFNYEAVDIRNVLIDDGCKKSSLTDCEDAIIFEYLSPGRIEKRFPEVNFTETGIRPMAPNKCFQDWDSLYGGDNKPMYEVMHYYNKIKDEYCILIHGEKIRSTPIPTKGRNNRKKIPITFFVDHKIPGSPYGIGEPTIIKAFREIKNKNRNLIYDVTKKAAKPTIAVDPLSNFSEEEYSWSEDFIRVSPNDMSPIPVTANLDAAISLDDRTDNDVIISTGVNILDTAKAPASEKATKTVTRKESQVAIIELGLTFNTNVGFKRLHTINADIIRLHLASPEFTDGLSVTTKGKKLFRTKGKKAIEKYGKFTTEPQKGNHTFKYSQEDVDYDLVPTLKTGNLAISKALESELFQESVGFLSKVAPEALDQQGIAEAAIERDGLPEKILKQDNQKQKDQDPNMIAQKHGAILPPEIQKRNQFMNANQSKGVAEVQAAEQAMAAAGAQPGQAPAQPV